MSAVMQINTPIETEILSADELAGISGRSYKDDQITWLKSKGWKYDTNAAGKPIVGRLYARMKLAGVELSEALSPVSGMPDFSKVA